MWSAQLSITDNERDLGDVEAGLEQATGGLVAKVVKVQILDLEVAAGAPEGSAERFAVAGKEAIAAEPKRLLLLEQSNGVIAGGVKQRHLLVIARLPAWILAVANDRKARRQVDVLPQE